MASQFFQKSRLFLNPIILSSQSNIRSLSRIKYITRIESKFKYLSSSVLLDFQKRNYSLKLYSQYIEEEVTVGQKVLQYIKLKNNFLQNDCIENLVITNVFDNEGAIKQLQSIILHSLEPQPDDVIKLFVLYNSHSQSQLLQTWELKKSSKLLELKVQSAILLMSFDQLSQFAVALKNVLNNKITSFHNISIFLFEECLTRAETSQSLSETMKYFLIGFHLFSNNISSKMGYMEFISVFEKLINQASPHQLCQILYFCGLAKKRKSLSKFSLSIVNSLLPCFDEISFIDAGLAINGIFKLDLEPEGNIEQCIKKILIQEIEEQSNGINMDNLKSFAFVSLVKYLRFTFYEDDELLRAMKSFIQHIDPSTCNPQIVGHVLALFANCNYYDEEVYTILSNMFFKYLRSYDDVVRIKDISQIMWTLSHAQHQCRNEDLELVTETLQKFSYTGDFLNHASHVVDSTLYLSVLGLYSEKLMELVLQPKVVKIFQEREKKRYLSRLLVLNEIQKTFFPSMTINLPDFSQDEVPHRKISRECHFRPCLKRIQSAVNWLERECGVKVFDLKFLIPHIHYCSFAVCLSDITDDNLNATSIGKRVLENLFSLKDLKIAIDIDDKNTSLNKGQRTNGLETLKRKLLRMKGWNVKVLNAKDIEMCGDDDQAIAALILETAQS